MAFFILLALSWALLWRVLPDATPGQLSFTDGLRWLPLLFSFMAFAFACLMLVIRYWGLDWVRRIFPQTRLLIWLGQHAYQYSQPSTTLHITYLGPEPELRLTIQTGTSSRAVRLPMGQGQTVALGYLNSNPEALWVEPAGTPCQQPIAIEQDLKKFGKNMIFAVTIQDSELQVTRPN